VKKKKLQKKLAKTKKRLATAMSELKELRSQNAPVVAASVPVSGDELFETAAAANGHAVGIN
jgi:hypothetical protein